jgi:hypothetical protein
MPLLLFHGLKSSFPHLSPTSKKTLFHLYVTRQAGANLLSYARVTGECIYIL